MKKTRLSAPNPVKLFFLLAFATLCISPLWQETSSSEIKLGGLLLASWLLWKSFLAARVVYYDSEAFYLYAIYPWALRIPMQEVIDVYETESFFGPRDLFPRRLGYLRVKNGSILLTTQTFGNGLPMRLMEIPEFRKQIEKSLATGEWLTSVVQDYDLMSFREGRLCLKHNKGWNPELSVRPQDCSIEEPFFDSVRLNIHGRPFRFNVSNARGAFLADWVGR